jgi:hypothetical protein
MSTNIANTIPAFSQKTITNVTWGAGGATTTITDANIHPTSQIEIWVTGTTPQAGNWSYVYNQGNVVITSSASESSTLPLAYYIN